MELLGKPETCLSCNTASRYMMPVSVGHGEFKFLCELCVWNAARNWWRPVDTMSRGEFYCEFCQEGIPRYAKATVRLSGGEYACTECARQFAESNTKAFEQWAEKRARGET